MDPITRTLTTIHTELAGERGGRLATTSRSWLLHAGLPAKSGLFSPPVDARGNSVRGVRAARRVSGAFELDLVRHSGLTAPVIRRLRRLSPSDTAEPGEPGGRIAVVELQGELDFAAAELVLADLLVLPEIGVQLLLLDLALVWRIRPVAVALLSDAIADLARGGVRTAVAGPAAGQLTGGRRFARPSDALAWCDDELLTGPTE